MRNCLNILKTSLVVFVSAFCLCANIAHASGLPSVKTDGYNQVVQVWHDTDPIGFLKIIGTYGVSGTPVDITDSNNFHAFNPVLATSRSNSASTTAVAIWQAYDFTNMTQVMQVAVATAYTGWTVHSGITISDLAEIPQSEYSVDISDDGSTIGITWTSYLSPSNPSVVRRVYSTDNGNSWSSPQTL